MTIRFGLVAGEPRVPDCLLNHPSFPAETTTKMPFCHATSRAWINGSRCQGVAESVLKARSSTRTFIPSSFLCWTTQLTAAITWLMSERPWESATLTESRRASGAMPRKFRVSVE